MLRLDGLLKERDAALDRQTAHIHHLEALVGARDAQLAAASAKRDAQERELDEAWAAAAHTAEASDIERERLERAIAAQERIITYRQSARWWIRLPWLRLRLLWNRLTRA